MRIRAALDVLTTLVLLTASSVLLWRLLGPPVSGRPATLPTEPISLAEASLLGSDDAPVVIVEFSDFQCPFCKKFSEDVLPQLRDKYIAPGLVQLAFVNLPLDAIHPLGRQEEG